jgi:hypothetical protein
MKHNESPGKVYYCRHRINRKGNEVVDVKLTADLARSIAVGNKDGIAKLVIAVAEEMNRIETAEGSDE